MKRLFVFGIAIALLTTSVLANTEKAVKEITVKNKLFTIYIPEEFKGTFDAEIKNDRICIYDKASKNAGFGGFAFGIKAYKNPADHAVLPGSIKIGELTDKKGKLYDMVLKHPTDVQYDYTKSSNAPYPYSALYKLGDNIEITGTKKNKFFKNQGMKGEDLYKEVLKKHVTAINEKWNSNKLEKENMSFMYNVIAESKKAIDTVGYAYYDVNMDGIDELFIGEIADGEWKGVVYDIYTMVNRKPKHVISGGNRNRFFVCDNSFICNEYSSGAYESGTRVYALMENSTELFPQVSFKYEGYKQHKTPWYISYGSEAEEDKWQNVTEGIYNERKSTFDKYERFDYKPLSEIKF
jgi:hypothetical protein